MQYTTWRFSIFVGMLHSAKTFTVLCNRDTSLLYIKVLSKYMKYKARLYHSCRCFDQNLVRQSFIIRTFATNGSVKDYVINFVNLSQFVLNMQSSLNTTHVASPNVLLVGSFLYFWNTVEQRICVLNPLKYSMGLVKGIARRRHDLEPISASLILCGGSPTVTGGFPSQMAKYRVVLMVYFSIFFFF